MLLQHKCFDYRSRQGSANAGQRVKLGQRGKGEYLNIIPNNMTNKQPLLLLVVRSRQELISKPLPDRHLSPTFLSIKGKGRAEDIKSIITKYE